MIKYSDVWYIFHIIFCQLITQLKAQVEIQQANSHFVQQCIYQLLNMFYFKYIYFSLNMIFHCQINSSTIVQIFPDCLNILTPKPTSQLTKETKCTEALRCKTQQHFGKHIMLCFLLSRFVLRLRAAVKNRNWSTLLQYRV